jgi:putative Mn2+ efflux pump MntP
MGLLELLLVAVGLSMDAFAVAICKGLSIQQEHQKRSAAQSVLTGLWFGVFQGAMPLIGFYVGGKFSDLVGDFDHWIVFLLLALIGGKMIRESREPDSCPNPSFKPLTMLPLAVATSIDALAVGVSFAFLKVNIFEAASIIAATTFILSAIGVQVGCFFGTRFKSRAELAGGLVLIAIGIKVLVEHLLG